MTRILTTTEAARELGRRPATLRSWRLRGIGPRWSQPAGPGTACIYTETEIDNYRTARMED